MRYVGFARRLVVVALFVLAAVLGIASGVIFAYAGDLPQISALDDYAPSTISRVYGARGEVVGEFAIERREVIPYERDLALPASRRSSRPRTTGSISTSASASRASSSRSSRTSSSAAWHGASTLTQQLARKLFLTDDKTPGNARSRKRSSRSRSRSATPSARSSRSTATRCTSGTAPTASRRRRGSTSASRRRT